MYLSRLRELKFQKKQDSFLTCSLEIERVAIHIADMGAMAGDIGYYPLLGVCSTDRGIPLGVMETLTGSRFGKSCIFPGEVKLKRIFSDRINSLRRKFKKCIWSS